MRHQPPSPPPPSPQPPSPQDLRRKDDPTQPRLHGAGRSAPPPPRACHPHRHEAVVASARTRTHTTPTEASTRGRAKSHRRSAWQQDHHHGAVRRRLPTSPAAAVPAGRRQQHGCSKARPAAERNAGVPAILDARAGLGCCHGGAAPRAMPANRDPQPIRKGQAKTDQQASDQQPPTSDQQPPTPDLRPAGEGRRRRSPAGTPLRREERGGGVRGNLQGKGRGAPAAALIVAGWTSTGELRRRRGWEEEWAGCSREGWRHRPSRPRGRRGGRAMGEGQDLHLFFINITANISTHFFCKALLLSRICSTLSQQVD
ncbi:hypothetical protein PVAP13_8NG116201 [Panicum virgatum]|uniref:Uncharacterized protein n=1 Tax=Panicum virgatum TaxID=38727 RepID=A0A8T0P9L0_PANVG|nr:hypothetical protein PVAP13_8NG116201 [Panicum virgatum]